MQPNAVTMCIVMLLLQSSRHSLEGPSPTIHLRDKKIVPLHFTKKVGQDGGQPGVASTSVNKGFDGLTGGSMKRSFFCFFWLFLILMFHFCGVGEPFNMTSQTSLIPFLPCILPESPRRLKHPTLVLHKIGWTLPENVHRGTNHTSSGMEYIVGVRLGGCVSPNCLGISSNVFVSINGC